MNRTGEEGRDEGMDRVRRNAGSKFRKGVESVTRSLSGQRVTGEDIRLLCEEMGTVPHHPNAWGGTMFGLKERGVLVETGERQKMKAPRSHARTTDVYLVHGTAAL